VRRKFEKRRTPTEKEGGREGGQGPTYLIREITNGLGHVVHVLLLVLLVALVPIIKFIEGGLVLGSGGRSRAVSEVRVNLEGGREGGREGGVSLSNS